MPAVQFDISRFENALHYLDECSFNTHLYRACRDHNGMIDTKGSEYIRTFLPRFRSHLLEATTRPLDQKFLLTDERKDPMFGASLLAMQLFAWCKYSRVVYHLDDQLRILLQATSFSSAKWDSIPWPFDSFAVTLENPVATDHGRMIDTILFSKLDIKGKPNLTFTLLPQGMAHCQGLSPKQKERYFLLARRKNFAEIERRVNARDVITVNNHAVTSFQCILADANFDDVKDLRLPINVSQEPSPTLFPNTTYQGAEIAGELIRMVAALSLYLTTLPPSSKIPSIAPNKKIPIMQSDDGRLIRLPSHVCRLTNTFTLSNKEVEEMEEAMAKERTGMVVPHWRRGYFKRPPGFGHDSTAQRTLWVRPTLVNKQNLPDQTLPGGSFVRIKNDSQQKSE